MTKPLIILLIITLTSWDSHAQTLQNVQADLLLKFEGNNLHWNLPFPKAVEQHIAEQFGVIWQEGLPFFHFENVELRWSERTMSYWSDSTLALRAYHSAKVQYCKGQLEYQADSLRGDVLNLTIYAPGGDWYRFQVTSDILASISSNPQYNNLINSFKKRKSKVKVADRIVEFMVLPIIRGCYHTSNIF